MQKLSVKRPIKGILNSSKHIIKELLISSKNQLCQNLALQIYFNPERKPILKKEIQLALWQLSWLLIRK